MLAVENRGGQVYIGNLNRVFHCHHYNSYLQMTVLMTDGMGGYQAKRLLQDAITPLVKRLKSIGCDQQKLVEEFSYRGFGRLIQQETKQWLTPNSHYGQSAYINGKPNHNCFFTAGYLQGITGAKCTEVTCQHLEAEADQFRILATYDVPDLLKNEATINAVPDCYQFEGCDAFDTTIDESSIIEAVSGLPLVGRYGENETGLIDGFGVSLTQHFADYYNIISYETYHAMLAAGLPREAAAEVFIQAGHVCAFHTFGGIMESPEWYAVVAPMCKTREDWIHGMVAVINALGWGTWRIESIKPEQQLVLRIYNSYEGVGYQRLYHQTDEREISFLAMGGAQGLAHLLWKIDIRDRPDLTNDYYNNAFNSSENRFGVKQTHAIAAGDEYDRVVVTRSSLT